MIDLLEFTCDCSFIPRCNGGKFEEPHTPSRRSEPKPKKMVVEMEMEMSFSNIGGLLWRQRKPFRRAARKRSQLQTLSPFFYVQDK